MVTATKDSNSSSNSLDSMVKSFTSNTNFASKSASEVTKTLNNSYTSRKDDFKNVLKSKSDYKDHEDNGYVSSANQKQNSTEVKDTDKDTKELNEKLEELEKESKTASKDKLKDILSELLSLLAKLGIKQDSINANGAINSKVGIDGANSTLSNSGLNDVMGKIMELLKNDSVKSKLDSNSLNLMEKLLGNLNGTIKENATELLKVV